MHARFAADGPKLLAGPRCASAARDLRGKLFLRRAFIAAVWRGPKSEIASWKTKVKSLVGARAHSRGLRKRLGTHNYLEYSPVPQSGGKAMFSYVCGNSKFPRIIMRARALSCRRVIIVATCIIARSSRKRRSDSSYSRILDTFLH